MIALSIHILFAKHKDEVENQLDRNIKILKSGRDEEHFLMILMHCVRKIESLMSALQYVHHSKMV